MNSRIPWIPSYNGNQLASLYDSQGRLASVTLPDLDGNPATTNDIATYGYKYDARGNLVQLTDPLGRDTRFTFNNQGQQLTRTLPLGCGTDGMFGTVDDPAVGQASSLPFTEHTQYDTKGRKVLETSFEGVVTEYLYDDAFHGTGRLYQKKFYASEAAFNAGTVKETQTLTFDAFGRELSTQWTSTGEPGGVSPRSDVWTNQYDVQGRLLSVASPTGTVFYEYDVFGRQTRVMSRGAGFQPANATDYETDIHYSYDSLGRLSKVETFERNDVAVDVDPNTAGNQPEAESYAYTLNGNLDYEINPDGSTTDYTYDELNRLTDLDEYRASTTTPSVFTDNPKLSEYNYTLRADGKKESADEIIYATDGTTPVSHTQFDWTYDNASRLTDEVFTDVGDLLHFPSPGGESQGEGAAVDNYHTSFEYDLTGNRLTQTTITDTNHDGVFNAAVDRDEVTTYTSDANDRMLSESTVVDGAATESTAYGYTGTQQSSKSVVSEISNTQISNQSFAYDLQGRMFQATTETFNAGTLTSRNRATYQYGTDGIRFSARSETDSVLNLTTANWQLTTDTKYLIDANNHTGYQQVLEETATDANGNLVKKIVYTIGLDHISQTTFTPGGPAQGTTAVFHMDGHGSTRILTDLAGAILNIGGFAQIYHYTAYGEAINFQMANATTQYLYSGEQFDARIGQQYLRARYYNQANGTFNRLDPFFGNTADPQSFHKYLYTHGDPVNAEDPTGLMSLSGMVAGVSIAITLFTLPNIANAPAPGDQTLPDNSQEWVAAFALEAIFAGVFQKVLLPVGGWAIRRALGGGSRVVSRFTASFANSAIRAWKLRPGSEAAVSSHISNWISKFTQAGGRFRIQTQAFNRIKNELTPEAAEQFKKLVKPEDVVNPGIGNKARIVPELTLMEIGEHGNLGSFYEELLHFVDLHDLVNAADRALKPEFADILRNTSDKLSGRPYWGKNVPDLSDAEFELLGRAMEHVKDQVMNPLFESVGQQI